MRKRHAVARLALVVPARRPAKEDGGRRPAPVRPLVDPDAPGASTGLASPDSGVPMAALAAAVRACRACGLCETRIQAVPGEGPLPGDAAWSGVMLVGEAPGRNEDETGRPFCGAAGKNLDLGLAAALIPRESVFVTSVVKCRPPGNRDPTPQEKQACAPHLEAQVALLRPKVIVALGRHALGSLCPDAPAQFTDAQGTFLRGPGGVPVFASLHPAAVIYRQKWKEAYLEDWRRFGAWVRSGAAAPVVDPTLADGTLADRSHGRGDDGGPGRASRSAGPGTR